MLWIYQRGRDRVRIATTYDSVTDEYVIKTTGPDGTALERFKDAETFQCRYEALETALRRERWRWMAEANQH